MAPVPALVGHRLAGRYVLAAPVGVSGHSTVWRARDELLERDVAVKLLDDDAEWLSWAREARAAAAIHDPHVVSVFDAGSSDVGPFVVMELLHGESLADRLARGPLSDPERTVVDDGLLQGLAAVHRAGLVHRDVKPANVFLCDDGRVVLTDFGIARHVTSETTEVQVVGTPGFVAPERLAGEAGDARADVFAAGRVLEAVHDGAPDRAAIAPVLERATAPDPARRPADAAALRAALVAATGAVGTAPLATQIAAPGATRVLTAPPPRVRTARAVTGVPSRRARLAGVAALVGVALVGIVAAARNDTSTTPTPTGVPATVTTIVATTRSSAPPSTPSTTAVRARSVTSAVPTTARHEKRKHRHKGGGGN